jgi:cytochrome c1
MKRILQLQILVFFCLAMALITLSNCATPEAIAGKSGAQLWGENCNRCHNAPSPAIYSDAQWEVVGDHMRYKANLTDQEVKKIVEFLKSAN